jgi:hypothetical protein
MAYGEARARWQGGHSGYISEPAEGIFVALGGSWSYLWPPRARGSRGEARKATWCLPGWAGLALEFLKVPRSCEAVEDGTAEGLAGGAVDAEQEVLLRARLVETTDEDRLVTCVPAELIRDLASLLIA